MPKIPDQKLRKTPPGTAGPGAMGDPQPKALTKEMPYATPGNPESDMPADAMAHGYDTTDYDYSSEPLGAQILRRLHDDHCWLMSDYDSMLGPLEDKHVTKFLMEHLAHIEKSLSTIEKLWSKHERYSELPPLENAMQDEALDEEALNEELGEEGQLDPEYMEAPEEDLSTQTEQDLAMGEANGIEGEMPIDQLPPGDQDGIDTMDNDVVPAGSGAALPETPPDEAWEASQTRNKPQAKRLQTRRKSMCPTCKNMQCKCGTSCNTKNLNTVKPKEVYTRDGTSKDQELSLGQEWTDSEKDTIFEAMDFLGEISQDNSPFDEESRMKSYHYHKTLDKMSKIKAYYKDEMEYEEKSRRDRLTRSGRERPLGNKPFVGGLNTPGPAPGPGDIGSVAERVSSKPTMEARRLAAGKKPIRGKSGGDLPEHSDHRLHDEDYALRNTADDLGITLNEYGHTGGQVHGQGQQDAYDNVYEGYDPYEALVGGQQQNSMSTDQEQEAWNEAQDMHPHRLASREASDFFHRLAGERAFGNPHRQEAQQYLTKLSELLNNKAAPQTSGLGGSPEGMDAPPAGADDDIIDLSRPIIGGTWEDWESNKQTRNRPNQSKSLDSILDHQESQLEVLTKNLNSVLTLMKR